MAITVLQAENVGREPGGPATEGTTGDQEAAIFWKLVSLCQNLDWSVSHMKYEIIQSGV